ncbi:MAG TPA: YheU family protein [Psychromonas hadalis]|nr:YheU family protein [Psychromonas hadalis]
MLIPYQALEKETLFSIIEQFILREGTDYGEIEQSLNQKSEAVFLQIKAGKVFILYSELEESITLIDKLKFDQLTIKQLL